MDAHSHKGLIRRLGNSGNHELGSVLTRRCFLSMALKCTQKAVYSRAEQLPGSSLPYAGSLHHGELNPGLGVLKHVSALEMLMNGPWEASSPLQRSRREG